MIIIHIFICKLHHWIKKKNGMFGIIVTNVIISDNFLVNILQKSISDTFCITYVETRKRDDRNCEKSWHVLCLRRALYAPYSWRSKKKERQPSRRRERRSGREKRKVRQRPVVPWRAIYRTPDFFPSFFIPASRAPGGPLRLSFAFCLRRKSPHACSSSSLLPLVLFLCTDRPTNVPSPSSLSPSPFSLGPLPHVRVPGHSFVEFLPFLLSLPLLVARGWRGGIATLTQMEKEKRRMRRNYGRA